MAVLLGGILAVPGFGQVVRSPSETTERQPPDPESAPEAGAREAGTFKSLTPEERRKRTLRRKLRRADELIESGKYEEGAALIESLDLGGSPHANSALAFSYSRSNEPDKAIRYYERVLKNPDVPESVELLAHHQLARLYYGRGREQLWDEDAEKWFRRALGSMQTWIQRVPSPDPDSYLFLARVQLQLNDVAAGIASLESAVDISERQGTPVKEGLLELLERLRSANET